MTQMPSMGAGDFERFIPNIEHIADAEGENKVSLQVKGYFEKLAESSDADKDRKRDVVRQVLKYVRFVTTSQEAGVKDVEDIMAVESLIDECENISIDLGKDVLEDIDGVRELSAEAHARIVELAE